MAEKITAVPGQVNLLSEQEFSRLVGEIKGINPLPVVAMDGLALAGKGTTCEILSEWLGVKQIPAGVFYRAVTYKVLRNGGIEKFEQWTSEERREFLEAFDVNLAFGEEGSVIGARVKGCAEADALLRKGDLYARRVTAVVPRVASLGEVRDKIEAKERELISESGGPVEGRNMATEVFADEDSLLKVYLTADDRELADREKRRARENDGEDISIQEALKRVQGRNEADHNRVRGKLLKPEEAERSGIYDLVIDTSGLEMTPRKVAQLIVWKLAEKLGSCN